MKKDEYLADIVKEIPASVDSSATITLNVRSYAGYAQIEYNGKKPQLFYWFFESQEFHPNQSRNLETIGKRPFIVWLNGGPGAPSTLGLFLENGPYRIQETPAGELIENNYSWNRDAHIIYWDQPVGTGYSDVKDENPQKTYAKNEDELSEMFYLALQSFFDKHPEYRPCPVFVTGESYGGKYIPNIALKIHEKNSQITDENQKINLKGISVGDGWIDARLQMQVYIDYAYTLGYLDTTQKNKMFKAYESFTVALDQTRWEDAYTISNTIVDNVSALGGGFNVYNIQRFSEISMANVQKYMERSEVKQALNVPEKQPWNCADNEGPVANNLIKDNMQSSTSLYSKIIQYENLYKVLMYTGTLDTACGSLSTEMILYTLDKWRDEGDNKKWQELAREIWAQPHTNVKGFIKQYKNLSQIVIPLSGHQVPYYKPEISLDMINKWMNNEPFPTYLPAINSSGTGDKAG